MSIEKTWLRLAGLDIPEDPEELRVIEEAAKELNKQPTTSIPEPNAAEVDFWLEAAGLQPRYFSQNPINVNSLTKDQEMHPIPLGQTFLPEELDELVKMKEKLHELGSKCIEADVNGDETKADKIRKQIDKLNSEIDEFSSMLNVPFDYKHAKDVGDAYNKAFKKE